ncbi:uncharacterized protein [Acropora muricata]|uniref:uncharacterized protein n=1 Tax=Acropora muricata TaxID=159855 RepID=UPI0034E41591
MSVSMHLLLKFWATCPMNNNATVQQDSSQTSVTNNGNAAALSQTTGESTSQAENNATDVDDAAQTVSIGPQAIAIAHSIVNTALTQLCLLTKKKFIINGTQEENENDNGEQQHDNDFIKLYCAILSCPGKVVSLSVLNKQGVFRKTINGKTGKALMAEITDGLAKLGLGKVETYTIPANKTQVHYFIKEETPQTPTDLPNFVSKLARVGIHLEAYENGYHIENQESKKHWEDYNNRRETNEATAAKRQRIQ